jgi:hypothetical protein
MPQQSTVTLIKMVLSTQLAMLWPLLLPLMEMVVLMCCLP